MTQKQIVELINQEIDAAIAAATPTAIKNPTADWSTAKSSVLGDIVNGIAIGVAKAIKAHEINVDKINKNVVATNFLLSKIPPTIGLPPSGNIPNESVTPPTKYLEKL